MRKHGSLRIAVFIAAAAALIERIALGRACRRDDRLPVIVTQLCDRFRLGRLAHRAGICLCAVCRAGRSGGHGARVPSVLFGSGIITVDRARLHLARVARADLLVAPVGPIRPALISKELFIVRIALGIDRDLEIPIRIRAAAAIRIILAVTAVGALLVRRRGIRCAEESVEGLELAFADIRHPAVDGAGRIAAAAPVPVDIAADGFAVDNGLCRGRLRGGNRRLVVGSVQRVSGVEAAGPGLDIGDRTGIGLFPVAALARPAALGRVVRGLRLIFGEATLRLALDQAVLHAGRLGLRPVGPADGGSFRVGLAADGAGVFRAAGSRARRGDRLGNVLVRSHFNHRGIHISAGRARSGFAALSRTAGFLNDRPVPIGMAAFGYASGFHTVTLGARSRLYAILCAGCRLGHNPIAIAMQCRRN